MNQKIDALTDSTNQKIDVLTDRITTNDQNYRSEFKKLNKKLDGITEVVAKTMEDITEIKCKMKSGIIRINTNNNCPLCGL